MSEPETVEEQLLAALLSANQELTDALRVYEDLERVKIEREAERRSRKETRMDPRVGLKSNVFEYRTDLLLFYSKNLRSSTTTTAPALLDDPSLTSLPLMD